MAKKGDGQLLCLDSLDQWFKECDDWRPYADVIAMPPLAEELMEWWPGDVSSEVLARAMEPVWERGICITRGAIYARCRRERDDADGKVCTDKWATMLALQAPPGISTTDTFWAGRKSWVDVYGEEYANRTKKALAAKGVNLKPGDEYMPELARHPNDPEAVVPFGGARSYIKKLCERRGWAAHGAVEVKHRQPDKDPYEDSPKMADDLVRKYATRMVKSNPELRQRTKAELRAEVLRRHGPSR